MLSYQRTARKSIGLAWVLLSVGLIATAVAAIYMKMDVDADAKRQFDFACSEIRIRIGARIDAHAQILKSAAALFDATDEVTREKWHAFTSRQQIEQHLPGIQGIGFSLAVPREWLVQHIREIRSQGFSDYTVKPAGDRESYTSIIFLEPFSGRNLRAFGYDMFSEPVRRKAMERARDLDVAAISGKVILVQETDQDVQVGTLMYVPVYRKGMTTDTVAHRRAALYGWVYSPYRMNDLMQGISRGWDLEAGKRIRLQVFDNERLSPDSLLYDSQPKEGMETVNASRLTLQTSTSFKEHLWYLRFTQTGGLLNYGRVYGVLSGGTIISLLLFGLFISLLDTRSRAQQMADQLAVNLRESEEKYRIIFNNEIYAILIFDLETLRLLDVNDAYSRLYGYRREELLSGMTIHDITAEHQVSDAATRQAIQEGTIFIPLRYHRKKDGTVFPVEIVGGPYVWKGKKVMFALLHDITDRKQAEEALRDEHWRLESIIEGTHLGTWEWNVQTGETVFNGAWAQIIGYTLDELAPISIKTWEAFCHPDDLEQSAELLDRHFAGELPYYDCECRMKHKEGRWVWVHDRGRVITRTADGKPLMMFGTHADITGRKMIEEERKEWESQQRQLQNSESLGRMAGAIAHHFNNQLGVVIGNLEMAIEDLPQGSRPVHSLTIAMQAAGKAAEMSGMMLTYLGQTTGKRESLDFSATCRRGLPMLQAVMPGKVVLETDFPSPGPAVMANANQIQQVLTNLITNAWEAVGEDGGDIHLIIKTVSPAEITAPYLFPIGWQPQDTAYACLEVADAGCGIADTDISNLFDPFFSSKFTGRGMGLAVVMGIVRAHGGAVTVESEPGRGSIFQVLFPVSGEEVLRQPDQGNDGNTFAQGVPIIPSPIMPMEGGGTVLLVEDEEMVRDMAAAMLRRLGFSVLEAKNGIEAVDVFRQHRNGIRCVLTDLTMPHMDGWETLTALRKFVPDIPVILASGYDKAHVMTGDHPELPQAFLAKPYNRETLRAAISQALG